MDPAELRAKNFIRREQFPYMSALGWEYDSGDYHPALQKALDAVGYAGLRQEQAEKRARGELMGIGVAFFTEIVGAGPSRNCDILGRRHVRFVRDPGPPHGLGDRAAGHQEPGPGSRDHLRPDPGDRDRHLVRGHPDRGGQHRHRPLRPRHLRLALDAGGRCRRGPGRPQDPRQGQEDRRPPDGGRRPTTSTGTSTGSRSRAWPRSR